MAEILNIPLDSENASFKIRTILEDIELVLLISWNTRAERWYLTIMNATEVTLLAGIPMHVDTEFIERFQIDGLPPGKLLLYDAGGNSA